MREGGEGRDDRAGAVFEALADPTRRELLRRLTDDGPTTPTALAADLPISRQAVSKHLSALSEAGLVRAEQQGRERRYRATVAPLSDAVAWIVDVGAAWDDRLSTLRTRLAGRGRGTTGPPDA
jgi:DNA-binding transcriptional ArsR family regulator